MIEIKDYRADYRSASENKKKKLTTCRCRHDTIINDHIKCLKIKCLKLLIFLFGATSILSCAPKIFICAPKISAMRLEIDTW